jgi:hypothetical protein
MPTLAMGLLRILGVECVPPQKIHPASNGLKVGGIHARPVAAKMVELEILGDRSAN